VSELPLEIPVSLHKGDVIDGFALVKPFQHSDRVWLATRDGQRFTLKFAPIEARDNDAVLTQFVKETWNATRIEAEFFVKAFVPENATKRFYAMEFIEAPSLKMLLGSRRLAVDEAIALGKFLLKAGQYLLQLDLVHGDIKPENILVLSGYDSLQFKLIDLGSATEVFSITSRAGTPSYLAPERFHGAPICERTECFSIGVTWLESLLLRTVAIEPERSYQNYSEMLFDIEHPSKVEPFHHKDAPLLERNPLLFYKAGFFILLALALYLLLKLIAAGVPLP
jgi:serine/threonine protein kinase